MTGHMPTLYIHRLHLLLMEASGLNKTVAGSVDGCDPPCVCRAQPSATGLKSRTALNSSVYSVSMLLAIYFGLNEIY